MYTVEVEDGIDTTSFGGDDGFAQMGHQTLTIRRAGLTNRSVAFQRIDDSTPDIQPDFRALPAAPPTVREGQGMRFHWSLPCYNPLTGRIPAAGVHQTKTAGGAVPFQGMWVPTAST